MPAMRPLLKISLLCLLCFAAPLHAQEAPGEDIPGMHSRPDLSPSKELSPQERQGLNNMFKGKLEEEKQPKPTITNPLPTEPAPTAATPPANSNISPEPEIAPLPGGKFYMSNAHLLKFTILNKQTTRLYNQELNTGGSSTFGPLTIKLLECWHSSPDTTPDSAALLQITENRSGTKRKPLFLGWMFASTPSLNPLEHPVYDIIVKECR